MASSSHIFPLFVFPLPRMVFYPGTTKPLNVFEPRYVKMIEDAVETETPIALAYADPRWFEEWEDEEWGPMRRVAGAGQAMILDRREDGSLLVVVESVGKVWLRNLMSSEEPYLVAEGEWITENELIRQENLFFLNRLTKDFRRWLETQLNPGPHLDLFMEQLEGPAERINYYCSLMIHDAEFQQRLLETNDINEKIHLIGRTLHAPVMSM